MRRLVFAAVALAACTPGVGRPPVARDAEPAMDAAQPDAEVYPDAEPVDAGPSDVGLYMPDSGEVPSFPFTGEFGILNDNESLFAREVDDRLMLIVGDQPFVYVGTIDDDGNVATTSPVLERSGCPLARITGRYDRGAATYRLRHETCSVQGGMVDAEIFGGFASDYVGPSGVYALTSSVVQDLLGCSDAVAPQAMKIGINILPSGTVAAFTGVDVVSEPGVYVGRLSGEGTGFSAIQRIDANGSQQFAMSVVFMQVSTNDPITLTGERDVWDPEQNCSFQVTLSGERVEAP